MHAAYVRPGGVDRVKYLSIKLLQGLQNTAVVVAVILLSTLTLGNKNSTKAAVTQAQAKA